MKKHAAWVALFTLLFSAGALYAQKPLHKLVAGPAYTSADGRKAPRYPQVDVLVRLPGAPLNPALLKAGDFHLLENGAECGQGMLLRPLAMTPYGGKL